MPTSRSHQIAQSLSTDAMVELYQLDTTALTNLNGVSGTGSVYHWTPGTVGGAAVSLAGVSYVPLSIEGSGFDWNGQGKLPTPTLRITNIGGIAAALVIEFGDLLGAQVTRQLIFERFLDGQAEADPTAAFIPESYRVDRKASQTKAAIEFELRSTFDAQGVMLPRRQAIRNSCPLTYRAWNPATSAFIPGTCPWVGNTSGFGQPYFKLDGTSTNDPTLDLCAKKLTDCLARFSTITANPALPFGGFPGVGITPQ